MKEIKVTSCSDCPVGNYSYDWYGGETRCNINHETCPSDGLPDWCPLLDGVIVLELERDET